MDKPKSPNRKQIKKLIDGCCFFCKEGNYSLLDSHRIVPGSEGGRYTEANSLTVCASCHRRIHSGAIVIDRKYNSTLGKPVLHCWVDGEEVWMS